MPSSSPPPCFCAFLFSFLASFRSFTSFACLSLSKTSLLSINNLCLSTSMPPSSFFSPSSTSTSSLVTRPCRVVARSNSPSSSNSFLWFTLMPFFSSLLASLARDLAFFPEPSFDLLSMASRYGLTSFP